MLVASRLRATLRNEVSERAEAMVAAALSSFDGVEGLIAIGQVQVRVQAGSDLLSLQDVAKDIAEQIASECRARVRASLSSRGDVESPVRSSGEGSGQDLAMEFIVRSIITGVPPRSWHQQRLIWIAMVRNRFEVVYQEFARSLDAASASTFERFASWWRFWSLAEVSDATEWLEKQLTDCRWMAGARFEEWGPQIRGGDARAVATALSTLIGTTLENRPAVRQLAMSSGATVDQIKSLEQVVATLPEVRQFDRGLVEERGVSAFVVDRSFDGQKIEAAARSGSHSTAEDVSVGRIANAQEESRYEVPQWRRSEAGTLVGDAGLVILHPWIPVLLARTGTLGGDNVMGDPATIGRAAAILHGLVYGKQRAAHEFDLGLIQVLLGVKDTARTILRACDLESGHHEEVDELLSSVIHHWGALGKTGPDGLRQAFLQRVGILTESSQEHRLRVEKRGVDVLLSRVGWSFRCIRLPWMSKPLFVEWDES
jgi:hypothetical protein